MLKLTQVKMIRTKSGLRFIARYTLHGRRAATFVPRSVGTVPSAAERYLADRFGVEVDPDANMTANEVFGAVRELIHTQRIGAVKGFLSKRGPIAITRQAHAYAEAHGLRLVSRSTQGIWVSAASPLDKRPRHPSFPGKVWERSYALHGTHAMFTLDVMPSLKTMKRMEATFA